MSSIIINPEAVCANVSDLVRALRNVKVFEDLPEDGVEWMASQMSPRVYAVGEAAIREGEPADRMAVVLSGEFIGRVEVGPDDGRKYAVRGGEVTGMLPYSRMKIFPTTLRAVVQSCLASFPASSFDELLRRIPQLNTRFVGMIADRVRAKALNDQQMEKMAALGKLSAGVAHELNNPAAAAKRATESLREAFRALRGANAGLDKEALTAEQRIRIADMERDWVSREVVVMDSLDRGDLEEELSGWLERRSISESWQIAADLSHAGCTVETLNDLESQFGGISLENAIRRLSAAFTISRLLSEIESSTSRISELVRSIKEYSYMDRMPQQEVDVHDGIESTIVMLNHKLRGGINIRRDYDRSIPKIPAYGSELNQVWTNLIDNAADALGQKGEIVIHTANEVDHALVEIRDDGPGIPEEILGRIFEPFFTTKPVGKGTGLGLDAVYRTVEKHRGEVRAESRPGDTRFQVRLPISGTTKGETK
ncbi:MAG: sensor histidine kinase [Bryobacteraceae bacterium]